MARKDLDTLLRHLGQPGRYQIMIFILLMFQYFPLSFNNFAMLFIGGKPTKVFCVNSTTESTAVPVTDCSREMVFSNISDLIYCSKYRHLGVNESWMNTSGVCLCDCEKGYSYEYESETTIVGEVSE